MGASEGALYSVLAPTKIEWEEMRLTVDFGRIDDDSRLPALILLLLVLRDVAVDFYPEGGDLVAGVPNRVYLQARTGTSRPSSQEPSGSSATCRTALTPAVPAIDSVPSPRKFPRL